MKLRQAATEPISRKVRAALAEIRDEVDIGALHSRAVLRHAVGVDAVSDQELRNHSEIPPFCECDIKGLVLTSFRVACTIGLVVPTDGQHSIPPYY